MILLLLSALLLRGSWALGGTALSFPSPQSSTHYVRLNVDTDSWTALSISTWVRMDSDNLGTVFSYATTANTNELGLRFNKNCLWLMIVKGSYRRNSTFCADISTDGWLHLAGVWSSETGLLQGYINGHQVVSVTTNQGYQMGGEGILIMGQVRSHSPFPCSTLRVRMRCISHNLHR